MKERFEGSAGRGLLIEALQKQDIVRHDSALAAALADRGELIEFVAGDDIVQQDGADNDVHFLLTGEANVLVNSYVENVESYVMLSIQSMAAHILPAFAWL